MSPRPQSAPGQGRSTTWHREANKDASADVPMSSVTKEIEAIRRLPQAFQQPAVDVQAPSRTLTKEERTTISSAITEATTAGDIAQILDMYDDVSVGREAAQLVLVRAAYKGNAEVVRYVLRERNPDSILRLSQEVRHVACDVAVWKELLAFEPECINWPIGHHGDAVGLAVVEGNYELLEFLLDEQRHPKVDLDDSNYMTMPALAFARQYGCQEQKDMTEKVIALLERHGAPAKERLYS